MAQRVHGLGERDPHCRELIRPNVGRPGCSRARRPRYAPAAMPALVDTTIRLLSQEPLAGRVPTGELLQLAEVLDAAGFASLEVSGGGVFDSAVHRGVESPGSGSGRSRRGRETPLGLALRGRFLVGSRPVGDDFVPPVRRVGGREWDRRVPPSRSAERRLEPAPRRPRRSPRRAEFDAGLVYGSGRREVEALAEQARKLPELGAARILAARSRRGAAAASRHASS